MEKINKLELQSKLLLDKTNKTILSKDKDK